MAGVSATSSSNSTDATTPPSAINVKAQVSINPTLTPPKKEGDPFTGSLPLETDDTVFMTVGQVGGEKKTDLVAKLQIKYSDDLLESAPTEPTYVPLTMVGALNVGDITPIEIDYLPAKDGTETGTVTTKFGFDQFQQADRNRSALLSLTGFGGPEESRKMGIELGYRDYLPFHSKSYLNATFKYLIPTPFGTETYKNGFFAGLESSETIVGGSLKFNGLPLMLPDGFPLSMGGKELLFGPTTDVIYTSNPATDTHSLVFNGGIQFVVADTAANADRGIINTAVTVGVKYADSNSVAPHDYEAGATYTDVATNSNSLGGYVRLEGGAPISLIRSLPALQNAGKFTLQFDWGQAATTETNIYGTDGQEILPTVHTQTPFGVSFGFKLNTDFELVKKK